MNKQILIAIFAFNFINFSFSQSQQLSTLTLGKSSSDVQYDGHFGGFDFGFNTMMSAPFERSFDNNQYWKNNIANSFQFNFNLFDYKFPIIRQYLGLTTGFGISVSSYSFKNDAFNYTLQHTPDSTYAQVFSPGTIYNDTIDGKLRTNSLSLSYFTVPLLLEFATKERQEKSFYFAAGVIAGIRFVSNYAQAGRYENGGRFYNLTRAKYNTNLLSFEATVRLGYSWGGLFANYNLNTLFKEGKTVNVYPFRAGISFNIDYDELEDEDVDFDFSPTGNTKYTRR
jgi:hypothetical protein